MPDSGTRTLHRADVLVEPLPVLLRQPGSRAAPYRLSRGACVVGSGSAADLVIDEPTVSRTHVELSLVPEGVRVRDLGSRNGTFYLGHRIASATLAPGARIVLGAAPLAIELDDEHLSAEPVRRGANFRGMIGACPSMLRLFSTISRLDGSLLPVLVQGESGVGKELVARAIHEGSSVSSGPLVAINCGAISRELVASTLFGHRRGAFTGALDARKGAFASADGGTLFLDEIGELPLEVQPALLRALETGEIAPVGEDEAKRVRVRVVCATHRDLAELVASGRFREDLYYRIAIVTLRVPPLRERAADVPLLARAFARQEGAADLDADVVAELAARDFPGNVRELRNAVLAYVALGTLAATAPPSRAPGPPSGDVAPTFTFDAPYLAQRDALVERFTRAYLTALLERTGGNQSEAAKIAGLDRTYLGRLAQKLGLGKGR